MKWRLIVSESRESIYLNMGVDEAIMNSVREGISPPTLRFWRISDRAVSIGVHQKVSVECNLDFCGENGILVSRRISGGGSVYKDGEWELNYSLVLGMDDPILPSDIRASHLIFCGGLIRGLRYMGISAEMAVINDVVVNGRKISGNAQARKGGVVLNHGTILVGVDALQMFKALNVPEVPLVEGEDLEQRARRLSSRVTSLRNLLGREVEFGEVIGALIEGFREVLGAEFVKEELADAEVDCAKQLSLEKYATREWNFRR